MTTEAVETTSPPSAEIVDRTDTCCVVGAGSSGLAAAKNFLEYGHYVDIIEREDDVGGNWNFGKPNARVYESTHTISSKPFTQYPDFPMPDRFPDYPHHSEIHAYLSDYADHFGLRERVEFETSVVRIEPYGGGSMWDVTLELSDGGRQTRRYGAVVIANGHNWYPKMPDVPGDFDGEVIHAADYKRSDQLEDRRVLVVGAGNTGCDIAVEAAQHAEICFHSTRRAYWYAPKYTMGRPSDQIYDMMLSLGLPTWLLQALLEQTSRLTTGDLARFGLPEPDHHFLETHPIVNSLLIYYVGHGEIVPKSDLERYDGGRVVFDDGSTERVDLVVHATGYLIRFPFIDRAYLNWADGRPRLSLNVFHPEYDNLFVIGLIQPDSGQFKLVHWQAIAAAKLLQLRKTAPSRLGPFMERFRQTCDEQLSAGVEYKDSTRHLVEVQHMSYIRKLSELIDALEDELD